MTYSALLEDPQFDSSHTVGLLLILVPVIIQVVLFIGGLVSVLRSPRYTGGGKFLWVVVIFFAPFLGPLGWFVAGRTAQIRTSLP